MIGFKQDESFVHGKRNAAAEWPMLTTRLLRPVDQPEAAQRRIRPAKITVATNSREQEPEDPSGARHTAETLFGAGGGGMGQDYREGKANRLMGPIGISP